MEEDFFPSLSWLTIGKTGNLEQHLKPTRFPSQEWARTSQLAGHRKSKHNSISSKSCSYETSKIISCQGYSPICIQRCIHTVMCGSVTNDIDCCDWLDIDWVFLSSFWFHRHHRCDSGVITLEWCLTTCAKEKKFSTERTRNREKIFSKPL